MQGSPVKEERDVMAAVNGMRLARIFNGGSVALGAVGLFLAVRGASKRLADSASFVQGVPVFPVLAVGAALCGHWFLGRADSFRRTVLAFWLTDLGNRARVLWAIYRRGAIVVVPSTAWIGPGVLLGRGVVLGPGAGVCARARLSSDTQLGTGSAVGPDAELRGFCDVGAGARIGAGAVLEHVELGAGTEVAAGAILRDTTVAPRIMVRRVFLREAGLPLDKPGKLR